MIDKEWARAFAIDWIESWNSHDIDRILAHYTDDLEMSSPLIIERLGLAEGKLRGKQALGDYWLPSLSMHPPLRFELLDVCVGVDAMTIYYRSIGRRVAAETLFFNGSGQVRRGVVQWSIT